MPVKKQAAAETQVALARLAIEEGSPPMPRRRCGNAKNSSIGSGQPTRLAANVMLIRALLAENKTGDAEKEIEAARELARQSQNGLVRLQFDGRARVLLSSERPELSRPQSEKVLRDAREHGFWVQREAR